MRRRVGIISWRRKGKLEEGQTNGGVLLAKFLPHALFYGLKSMSLLYLFEVVTIVLVIPGSIPSMLYSVSGVNFGR